MNDELKQWVFEEKRKLWDLYQEGAFSMDTLKKDCAVLDHIFLTV